MYMKSVAFEKIVNRLLLARFQSPCLPCAIVQHNVTTLKTFHMAVVYILVISFSNKVVFSVLIIRHYDNSLSWYRVLYFVFKHFEIFLFDALMRELIIKQYIIIPTQSNEVILFKSVRQHVKLVRSKSEISFIFILFTGIFLQMYYTCIDCRLQVFPFSLRIYHTQYKYYSRADRKTSHYYYYYYYCY